MKISGRILKNFGLVNSVKATIPTPPVEGLSRPGYITANAKHYPLIKEMRDRLKGNPTRAEKIMWEFYRNKKLGYKIRRQHIIENFVTDFVCLSQKVVIEIDGKIHLKQKVYDEMRTSLLNQLGYKVIRFTNEEVYKNPEKVAIKTKEVLDSQNSISKNDHIYTPPLEGLGEVIPKPHNSHIEPKDTLDFYYAIIHSEPFQEQYENHFNIDLTTSLAKKYENNFSTLAHLGSELRKIHTFSKPQTAPFFTQYPIEGNNEINRKPTYKPLSNAGQWGVGHVYINDKQYFAYVTSHAWKFKMCGYQPAQKWLFDRKNTKLSQFEIMHYLQMMLALTETKRLMIEVNKVINFRTSN